MKASRSALLSAEIQRAVSNGAGSRSILTWYSASTRVFSTSSCSSPTTPTILIAADDAAEHLGHALLGQILERALELLGLHRILQPHAAQDLRREVGDADDLDRLALGQRVADAQHAVVGDADDVARPGLVDDLALAGEEQDRAS